MKWKQGFKKTGVTYCSGLNVDQSHAELFFIVPRTIGAICLAATSTSVLEGSTEDVEPYRGSVLGQSLRLRV